MPISPIATSEYKRPSYPLLHFEFCQPHLTLLIMVSTPLSTVNSAAFAFTELTIDLSKSSLDRSTASTHESCKSQYSVLNASYTVTTPPTFSASRRRTNQST